MTLPPRLQPPQPEPEAPQPAVPSPATSQPPPPPPPVTLPEPEPEPEPAPEPEPEQVAPEPELAPEPVPDPVPVAVQKAAGVAPENIVTMADQRAGIPPPPEVAAPEPVEEAAPVIPAPAPAAAPEPVPESPVPLMQPGYVHGSAKVIYRAENEPVVLRVTASFNNTDRVWVSADPNVGVWPWYGAGLGPGDWTDVKVAVGQSVYASSPTTPGAVTIAVV